MPRGNAKVVNINRTGLIGHDNVPNWEFIYKTSLVKDAGWDVGDVVNLPDGRSFTYAKSSGVCASGFGCDFTATGFQSYSTPAAAAAVGDIKVVVTGGTHDAIAKDELKGAYFVSWPAALKDQFRGIIGNDASDANADFTIYLDGPLTYALVSGSTGLEVFENPYAALSSASANASLGKAGIAATYVGATATYFWVQTRGIGWIAPQSTMIGNEGVGAFY
ncbi:hypothetical protein LCGC14_1688350, partial [marine sediment metagenome]